LVVRVIRRDIEFMEFLMRPIGVIHSPFRVKSETPIQASFSKAPGLVEVYEEFVAGLQDLEGFSHIFLIYVFNHADFGPLLVRPFLDNQLRGLFATRHPCRPNPIGISVVRLIAKKGNTLEVEGIDVLDGTPLLDIKPYVPDFDIHPADRIGWYATRSREQKSAD
jgi:tRNA-Thr(GGU) m(6)t(6)A37 methyltransferase TsaA